MPDGCASLRNTDVSNTYLLSKGIVVYVNAAGWPTMFITNTVGVGRLGTGGSITTSFDVFAGSATLMDMKKNSDCCVYCGKPSIGPGSAVCEDHGGFPVMDLRKDER